MTDGARAPWVPSRSAAAEARVCGCPVVRGKEELVFRHSRTWNPILVIVLLLSVGGLGCGSGSEGDRSSQAASEQEASGGQGDGDVSRPAAPDFSLRDVNGIEYSLRDYRGKVVFVNFWATWCGPCRREIPDLIELQKEHEGDLVILGISLDREGASKVRPFVESMGITYPILVDGDAVVGKFGSFNSIPMTFVIDRDGRVAEQIVGLQSKAYLQGIIDELKSES
jgi:thiol-disulfide isomerase/thioredoxin